MSNTLEIKASDFKKTEIGQIPKSWEIKGIMDCCSEVFLGLTTKVDYVESGGIPLIRAKDINNGYLSFTEARCISVEQHRELTKYRQAQRGDILITKSGTLGICAIVDTDKEFSIYESIIVLKAKKDEVLPLFLLWLMRSGATQKRLLGERVGSTVGHLNLTDFRCLQVPIPPLNEQNKIAEILSSVDEAIASTQAVIDQTRKVKQGLLQQLFTHDKDNKIQDNYNVKKYPLRFLDEVAKRVTGHTPNRQKPEYWDGGIKWVSLQDSAALDRVYIHQTAAEISEEGIRNSSAVKHPNGTVVLSRDAGVGKSAITTDEMAVSQHFIGWICGSELNNHYLYYWLQHMKPVFERIAIGNTIKTIGMPFFKSLKIPVPPIEIQVQIANTLLSHDQQIFSAEEELEQLNIIKRGLMQDLLTGRVRVKTPN